MDNVGDGINRMFKEKKWDKTFEELMQEVLEDPDVIQFIQNHSDQLNNEVISKSSAKLYEFVQEKNKIKLKKDTLTPGYKPSLVMNHRFIDVAYVPTAELVAKQKRQEIKNRMRAMDMPKDIREATFERYEVTRERSQATNEAIGFIESYTDNPEKFHEGLYLQGSFGVGKSYLLGAIAHELAEKGFKTTLVHFPSFAVEMKQSIGNNTSGEKIEAIKQAPVLMIDDIGADNMSSWIRDDVLGVILQYRMQEQLATFFSSNLDLKQLEEHLSVTQRGEEEPLKAKRLMERIRYLSKEINMTGQNRRFN